MPEPVPGNPGEKPDTDTPPPPTSNVDKVMDAIIHLKKDELSRGYDNLSGEIYASSRAAILHNSKMDDIVSQHLLGGVAPEESVSAWVSTYGYEGRVSGNDNAAPINHSGKGVAFGFDMSLSDDMMAGVLLGYETMKVGNGKYRNSQIDVEAYNVGGYLGANLGPLRLNGGIIYSYLDFDSERNIWIKGIEGKAKAIITAPKFKLLVKCLCRYKSANQPLCHKLGSRLMVLRKRVRLPRLRLWGA